MSPELGLMTVVKLWVFDKLFVIAVVDRLLVAAVDKLEVDIWVVDIVAVTLLVGNLESKLDDLFITRFMAWAWLASNSADSKSLAYDLGCDKVIGVNSLYLAQVSIETSQVSGNCFSISLFDGGKSIGQVINAVAVTKIS
ncbi:hypothetical protein G9A89_010379 [Geosiphon pyriformis]|nr:hypothetical protein G9A89_010379 [Geosiphon pyriformis]